MRFLTLAAKEIKAPAIYNNIKSKHIVISISGSADTETVIPTNINRVAELHLKFDDVSTIDQRFIYFDQSMATDIINFVNKHCNNVSLIICQCQAGLSRSVAVAAALAKILNYRDDDVFTKGIPNMFVYSTILDSFFGNLYWRKEWARMNTQRTHAMTGCLLSPAVIRLEAAKDAKRYE